MPFQSCVKLTVCNDDGVTSGDGLIGHGLCEIDGQED